MGGDSMDRTIDVELLIRSALVEGRRQDISGCSREYCGHRRAVAAEWVAAYY